MLAARRPPADATPRGRAGRRGRRRDVISYARAVARRRPRRASRTPPSSASGATSSAAPRHLDVGPGEAQLQGTLKRTPFARLLQRLYAQPRHRLAAAAARHDEEDRHLRRRLSGVGAVQRARRDAGPDPAGEAPHHQRGAGRIGGAHAEGEAPPGRDPRRDGRAVAVQPANARWSNRWRRSCSRSSRGPTASSCSRRASTPRPSAARWSARRRRYPRGHPPPLRRRAPGSGAGQVRGPVRRAQHGPGAAPAGDDVGPDRAGVHPEHRRHRAARRRPERAPRSPATRRACCWSRCPRRG